MMQYYQLFSQFVGQKMSSQYYIYFDVRSRFKFTTLYATRSVPYEKTLIRWQMPPENNATEVESRVIS